MPFSKLWPRLLLGLILAAGALWVLTHPRDLSPAAIEAWVLEAGPWLPVTFVLLHIPASLLFVPRLALGVVAGVLFGLWWGAFLSLVGATLGALVGFGAARYISADWLAGMPIPRLQRLLRRAEAEGLRLVLTVRLLPVLPHSAVNYGLGLTRVSLGAYLVGSVLGLAPSSVIAAYLGMAGGLALDGGSDWVRPLAWALGLLAASSLLPRLWQRRSPEP